MSDRLLMNECYVYFYDCLLVLHILLSGLCFLCFCIVFCIVSPHVRRCCCFICIQVYRLLPPGGNPTAVNKYIIPYHYRSPVPQMVIRIAKMKQNAFLPKILTYYTKSI
jgi:hypothetical protein